MCSAKATILLVAKQTNSDNVTIKIISNLQDPIDFFFFILSENLS